MEKEAKSLPKITINKIIKESLPEEVKCTADSQQLILQCCMEFLQLISSEANDICNKHNKKVIVPDHILMALQKLGFEKYIDDLKLVHDEHKRQEAAKPKISKRLEDSGLSIEELRLKQQVLFARAKSALNKQQEPSPDAVPAAESSPAVSSSGTIPGAFPVTPVVSAGTMSGTLSGTKTKVSQRKNRNSTCTNTVPAPSQPASSIPYASMHPLTVPSPAPFAYAPATLSSRSLSRSAESSVFLPHFEGNLPRLDPQQTFPPMGNPLGGNDIYRRDLMGSGSMSNVGHGGAVREDKFHERFN